MDDSSEESDHSWQDRGSDSYGDYGWVGGPSENDDDPEMGDSREASDHSWQDLGSDSYGDDG